MAKILPYAAAALTALGAASNLSAADPARVRAIANYVNRTGRVEYQIEGRDTVQARCRTFEFPRDDGRRDTLNEIVVCTARVDGVENLAVSSKSFDYERNRYSFIVSLFFCISID